MTTTENPSDLIDLFAPDVVADPFGQHSLLREQPTMVMGTFMGGPPMYLATRYDDVRKLLSDPRFLVNPPADSPMADIRTGVFERLDLPDDLIPWMANIINAADGEDHARLRKLVSYALTAFRINKWRHRTESVTDGLLDHLETIADEPVDLVQAYCYPLPVTVICELVGIDPEHRDDWRAWGDAMATMDGPNLPRTLRRCIDLGHEVLDRRRREPKDDLVTALVQAQAKDGNRVSDRELVGILFSLVTAGHQTTTYLIGNSVIILLDNPEQLERLKADPSLWPQAVRELQRMGPIQFGQPRFPTEDIDLGGVTIPQGAPVVPLITAANLDPRKFDDPHKLIVDRLAVGSESHLGFGKGVHRCLGQHLAYQEAEVALKGLFTRFPDLSLAVAREEIPWVLRPGFTRTLTLPLHLR